MSIELKPWKNEPDHLEFKYRKYPCIIQRAYLTGALCGYAGISPSHPFHKKKYHEIENEIDVHGALTYAEECQGNICHKQAENDDDHIWWLGFDCGHGGDISPKIDDQFDSPGILKERLKYASYKTVAYVKAEIKKMVDQLIEVENALYQ